MAKAGGASGIEKKGGGWGGTVTDSENEERGDTTRWEMRSNKMSVKYGQTEGMAGD